MDDMDAIVSVSARDTSDLAAFIGKAISERERQLRNLQTRHGGRAAMEELQCEIDTLISAGARVDFLQFSLGSWL